VLTNLFCNGHVLGLESTLENDYLKCPSHHFAQSLKYFGWYLKTGQDRFLNVPQNCSPTFSQAHCYPLVTPEGCFSTNGTAVHCSTPALSNLPLRAAHDTAAGAGVLHASQLVARNNQPQPAAFSTAKTRSWKKTLMLKISEVPILGVDPQTTVVMEVYFSVVYLTPSRQIPTNYIK
jgi:hypothetical protein